MQNLEDVIQTLIETNKKLIDGKIELRVAQQVSANTQVLINAARLQLDIFKLTKDAQHFITNNRGIRQHADIIEDDVVDCYNPVRNLV
jgi:hypothetical protein